MKIYKQREDYIDKSIRNHYIRFKNLDPDSIGKFLKEEGIDLDDATLAKRIEKIQDEIKRSFR